MSLIFGLKMSSFLQCLPECLWSKEMVPLVCFRSFLALRLFGSLLENIWIHKVYEKTK